MSGVGKTWLFLLLILKQMCTAPNQNNGSASPMPPPPPMPSVARASNAQPQMASGTSTAATQPAAATSTTSPAQTPGAVAPAANAAPSAASQPTAPVQPPPKTPVGDGPSIGGFNTTHFGNPDDPNLDSETKKGNGKWGKLVAGDSLAVSDATAARMGVSPGDRIELSDGKGGTKVGTYIDRVPASDRGERIDIYDPTGSEKKGSPFTAVSARKLSKNKTASFAQTLYPNQS